MPAAGHEWAARRPAYAPNGCRERLYPAVALQALVEWKAARRLLVIRASDPGTLSRQMRYDYDVRSCTVAELLRGDSPPFVVPEFQRGYSWTPSDIEALFEDVLDERHGFRARPTRYFLGAIVLVPRDGSLLVIDGQQRLATISITLAALRELMEQNGQHEDAAVLAQGLTTKQLGQDRRPRLELQQDDADAYREAIDGPSRIDGRKKSLSKVHRAAIVIREELLTRIARDVDDHKSVVSRIANRFFSDIELVRIDAPDEGSAYRLFEALNDRGRALTAADLIKNKVFARASVNLAVVREQWRDLQQGIDDDELLAYLRHFWIAFRGSVRRNELYDAYDHEVSNATPEQVAQLSRDLAKSANVYRDLGAPRRIEKGGVLAAVFDRLDRLNRLRVKGGRPVLLLFTQRWLAGLPALVAMLETTAVRHALVCQRNPNQLENAYNNMCHSLRELGAAETDRALDVVRENLDRWMPNDDEFRDALVSAQIRTNLAGWRMLLVGLEEASSSGEVRVSGPADVHVEHVLPQVPSAECLKESGLTYEAAGELAYRLGNLTLLSGKKNVSASNAAFSAKRDILSTSSIGLSTSVASNAAWGRVEIEARSRSLAETACRVWPWPPPTWNLVSAPRRRTRSSRSNSRHEPDQLDIPETKDLNRGGHRLDPSLVFDGTVWIPRLLWALDTAAKHGLGPIAPSELARLLERELESTIQATNTARAFRDLRASNPVTSSWWEHRNGKYVITDRGREVLGELQKGHRPRKQGRAKPDLAKARPPTGESSSLYPTARSTQRGHK
jgi:hypothetical protein